MTLLKLAIFQTVYFSESLFCIWAQNLSNSQIPVPAVIIYYRLFSTKPDIRGI